MIKVIKGDNLKSYKITFEDYMGAITGVQSTFSIEANNKAEATEQATKILDYEEGWGNWSKLKVEVMK